MAAQIIADDVTLIASSRDWKKAPQERPCGIVAGARLELCCGLKQFFRATKVNNSIQ
jgi:hypothetical protein